jgi:hypothetical protein
MIVVLTSLPTLKICLLKTVLSLPTCHCNRTGKWLTVHLLKMQIKTKDEVVRRVLAKMDQRSLVGQEKVRCYNDG